MALAVRDPRLGAAMRRLPIFPGFPNPTHHSAASHFHSLAKAIIGQQLSGKAAQTIHDRVSALTPGSSFPKAEVLVGLPKKKLRLAGLSEAKAESLRDLSKRIVSEELSLNSLSRWPDEKIIEALTEVRGIGIWSAQMFLMFRLGRLDVMPTTDLGIRQGVMLLDELPERPSAKLVQKRAEVWKPLSSVASWYLWRLTDEPAV
jgi:3-methyladenine DNA glycosylase/8-oxoguanine DNA glycosylase